jgi:predicted nucleic acid-binding protein
LTRRLSDVPDGALVFVDANIFVYHFTGVSAECSRFLARCEQGNITGLTGVHVLLEVLHRLKMVEAVTRGLVSPGNVARKLREHPEVVKELSQSEEQAEVVLRMGVGVMPVDDSILVASRQYRSTYGLMVNGSVTAAMARQAGVEAIASSDKDFLRIPGFRVYSPGDLRPRREKKG